MLTTAHYPWLDFARGLSAILVVAGHCRSALFPPFSSIASPSWFEQIFYAFTGLGHQAVMAFFVLSGFLVGGSVLRLGQQFRLADYFTARLCRLWIVLIPALLLTWIVDAATAVTASGALRGDYFLLWNSGPDPNHRYNSSIGTFVGNIVFLQTILVPVFGTNGPLWSLANEFWYYVVFPLVATGLLIPLSATLGQRERILIRLRSAFVVGATAYLMSAGMLLGFCVWLMGVLAFVAVGRLKQPVRVIWIALSLVLLACAIAYNKSARLQSTLGIDVDLALGFCFSVLVVCVARIDATSVPTGVRAYVLRSGGFLSRISYSLYLCHFPLLVIIAATFYPTQIGRLNWQSGAIYAVCLIAICIAGTIFWFLFERHTNKLRNWIRNKFTLTSRATV